MNDNDIFIIWKDGQFQGVVSGEVQDLLFQMETDFQSDKGCYLDWRPDPTMPLGFTLSDGRRVIRLGDYDLYVRTERELYVWIQECESKIKEFLKKSERSYNLNILSLDETMRRRDYTKVGERSWSKEFNMDVKIY